MTTINAMKFNDHAGCFICDEQRGWNDESLKILSADKIKPIISDTIRDQYGLVAYYGNTGTSSWGDELKFSIKQAIDRRYEELTDGRNGKPPASFLTIEELANLGYEVLTRMKHDHIDQTLLGRYGFNTNDFIRGYYESNGKRYDIKSGDVVSETDANLIWKGRTGEMTSIFLNAGILGGYEPKEGFRLFALSLITFTCEPVQEIFLCDGSGRDMATVRMTEYLNMKSVPERRGDIDQVEGLYAAIDAVNAALRHDIGCYGYYNIVLVDGKRKSHAKKARQFNDDCAKLAMESVSACYFDLIARDDALHLVEQLMFKDAKYEDMNELLYKKARDLKKMRKFLRGYKIF